MSRVLNIDVVSLYHEILINEIALMRSNTIVDMGINSGDAIVYVSSLLHQPNTTRGLDYLLLIFALLNGARRLVCGYNILRPVDSSNITPDCIDKVKAKLKEILYILTHGNKDLESLTTIDDESLEAILAKVVIAMLYYGLMLLDVRDETSNALSPLKIYLLTNYKKLQNNAQINDYVEFHAEDTKTLYELKVYHEVAHYFKKFGIDIPKALETFKKIFEQFTNVQLNEDLSLYKIQFKTLHGMLFKSTAYASALPEHPATLEANVLPFIIEPLPSPISSRELEDIKKQEEELIKVSQKCISEEALRIVINAFAKVLNNSPLTRYQFLYLKKMFEVCANEVRSGGSGRVLTAITSPTGTGKTYIFLLYALSKLVDAKIRKRSKKPRVLILYPRKALARDQLSKITELVYHTNNELKSRKLDVIRIGIFDGDSLTKSSRGTIVKALRGLMLAGERLCHAIVDNKYVVFTTSSNSCDINAKNRNVGWLYDVHDESILEKVDILVSNHSMLTKLIFDNFGKTSSSGFMGFIKDLEILILDEAHLYLDERLLEIVAPTLLKLFFLRDEINGLNSKDLDGLVKNLNMDIIVSSATLTDSSIITKTVNGFTYKMSTDFLIGFFKIKPGRPITALPQALEDFLRKLLIDNIYNSFAHRNAIIYYDYDAVLAENLNNWIWRGPFKIKVGLVTHPYPQRESWTSLAESLIAVTHFINAIRSRIPEAKGMQALTFIDMKSTLKDVFKLFIERQILEAQDHADRVLLTGPFIYDKLSDIEGRTRRKRDYAEKAIVEYINIRTGTGNVKSFDLIYQDPHLKNFNALVFYITPQDLKRLLHTVKSYDDFINTIKTLKLYRDIESLINSLNEFASQTYKALVKGWSGYKNLLNELTSKYKDMATILIHHGDLGSEERSIIESCMKKEREPIPLIVMSTSTLEIGVDIKDLAVVVQFSSYPHASDLLQRIGRSGRDVSSFSVSTLILVLRNTGEDIRYVIDQEVVEYVYNLEMPRIRDVIRDKEAVVRSLTYPLLAAANQNNVQIIATLNNRIKELLALVENSIGAWYNDLYYQWYTTVFGTVPPTSSNIDIDNIVTTLKKLWKPIRGKTTVIGMLKFLGHNELSENIEYTHRILDTLSKRNVPLLNTTLIISELQSIYEDLSKSNLPKEMYEHAHDVLWECLTKMIQLADQSIANLSKSIRILQKIDTKRIVWLHVSPGITNAIGDAHSSLIVYPIGVSRGKRDIEVEASEALKKIRPLHTGE
jgi:superfamily II DNA or RNA helicase